MPAETQLPLSTRYQQFYARLQQRVFEQEPPKRFHRNRPHTMVVGDIIHHSWGWEQTQCDYYQITEVTPHGATIRAIQSAAVDGSTVSHGMADRRTAVKDAFCGEPFKVRIDGGGYVTTLKHGNASKWDGRANYCSWYY